MKPETKIKVLFIIRVCLWIIALTSTIRWMYYSVKLHMDGIYEVHEYATLLRPVLYTGLIISFVAIGISFYLHVITVRIKKELRPDIDHSLPEKINR